jgi:MFS family permease
MTRQGPDNSLPASRAAGAEVAPVEPAASGYSGDEPSAQLAPSQRRRGLVFLCLAVGAVGFTLSLQLNLNANFLVEELGFTGLQMGLVEAVRETCGITAFVVLALLAGMAEPIIGSVMLLIVAAGLGAYCVVPSFLWVMLLSVVWSQGLHVWMPLPNSMAIGMAEPQRLGHRMGQVQAAGAVGTAAAIVAALVLTALHVHIRPMYVLAGVAAALGAAACWGIPRQVKVPGPRIVIRRQYWRYYLLCFLEGWRRQMSVTFAIFLLVKQFAAPLNHILVLAGVVQVVGYFASPRVGKLIDRVGERRILTFYYICLAALFVGYATIRTRAVLYGIFVVDSSFFVLAMALSTYVGRIAPPAERTATLSMGVACGHVAAVLMPLVSGILWVKLGYQWAFVIGVLATLLSIPVVQLLPAKRAAV